MFARVNYTPKKYLFFSQLGLFRQCECWNVNDAFTVIYIRLFPTERNVLKLMLASHHDLSEISRINNTKTVNERVELNNLKII